MDEVHRSALQGPDLHIRPRSVPGIVLADRDDSVEVLHGRVVNSGPYPIATFEATDAKELRREFERSVDEYPAWCQEDGVEPRRPFSGKLNLRLGSELHALVAAAAGANRMKHQLVDRAGRAQKCRGSAGRQRSGYEPDMT